MDAYFALVKGNLGPGVLALPYVFAQAGWVAGLPVLLVVVAQGVYAMLVLAQCKHALARPGVLDLGDVVHCALGPWGRLAADACVFIVQGGVCCCFVNLVATNLQEDIKWLSRKQLILILAPVFAVLSLLRFVAHLSCLNKLGNMAMALAVITGTWCGLEKLWSVGREAFTDDFGPRRPFTDPVMLASSVFFAFEGLGIVLPIEKEMAAKAAFPKVVVAASVTLAAAFLSLSITCGIAYRGALQSGSIVAFLASQPDSGVKHVIMQIASKLVTVAVLLTYPLQLLPASEIFEKLLEDCCGRASKSQSAGSGDGDEEEPRFLLVPTWIVQRLALVAATTLLAFTADNVALLVSLFGAVGQTGLGMLATLCHFALMKTDVLPWASCWAALDISIVVFCAVIMMFGTYFAFKDILDSW